MQCETQLKVSWDMAKEQQTLISHFGRFPIVVCCTNREKNIYAFHEDLFFFFFDPRHLLLTMCNRFLFCSIISTIMIHEHTNGLIIHLQAE